MVTDADLDGGGKMGRMLPLPALRRHWEDLDDLVPLPWLTVDRRRELRAILLEEVVPLREVYSRLFPGQPPAHVFRTAWDAIRYIAEECYGEDRLERFLDELAQNLPDDTARRLAVWKDCALPVRPVPAARIQTPRDFGPASIVVRLERRTREGTYDLSFASFVDGIPSQPTHPVEVIESRERAADRHLPTVREEVESRLPAMLADVRGSDWMIEFAMPESWLGKAVEEWKAGDTKMWVYPVVVRDVERLRPTFRQDRAILRWGLLRGGSTAKFEPVRCGDSRSKDEFLSWLTMNQDVCMLVHPQRPTRPQLTAALSAGMPVMLWPRLSCPAATHDNCAGERTTKLLASLIAKADPDELPWLVRKLRAEARANDKDKQHWGRRLTLLWDDPSRLPDPPLAISL